MSLPNEIWDTIIQKATAVRVHYLICVIIVYAVHGVYTLNIVKPLHRSPKVGHTQLAASTSCLQFFFRSLLL